MKTPISMRWAAAISLSLLAGTVAAQSNSGTFRATPSNSGSAGSRSAAEVRQVPAMVVTPGAVIQTTVSTTNFINRSPVVVFLPAVLLSDGTVIANFGLGFEPVRRACDASVVVVGSPTVVAGNGVVLSTGNGVAVAGGNGVVLSGGNGVVVSPQGNIPTFTQPVPNQVTPSQQLLPSNQLRLLTTFSQTSCFTRDGTGQFVVVQR